MNAGIQKWVMEKNLYEHVFSARNKFTLIFSFGFRKENSLWSYYLGPLLLIEYTAMNSRPLLSFYLALRYLKSFYLHFLFPSFILTSHLYNFPSKLPSASTLSQVCILPVLSHKLLPNSIAKAAHLVTRNALFYFYCSF